MHKGDAEAIARSRSVLARAGDELGRVRAAVWQSGPQDWTWPILLGALSQAEQMLRHADRALQDSEALIRDRVYRQIAAQLASGLGWDQERVRSALLELCAEPADSPLRGTGVPATQRDVRALAAELVHASVTYSQQGKQCLEVVTVYHAARDGTVSRTATESVLTWDGTPADVRSSMIRTPTTSVSYTLYGGEEHD